MNDIWTVSDWSIGEADPAAFVAAFCRFADAATALGGAWEGMITQDVQDPSHFIVIRHWENQEAVDAWVRQQHEHAEELLSLVPGGGNPAVLTKVADLGRTNARVS